jgi:glycosyltransferase involved in cell wall biosynthesis
MIGRAEQGIDMRSDGRTLEDLTIVIKTFERPECLRRLLASVRCYYPSVPVVVVDDSQAPVPDREFDLNTRYIHTEFDIGASEGRNRGVAIAETEYVFVLDDDHIFVEETRLDRLQATLSQGEFDIVGTRVIQCGIQDRNREYVGIFDPDEKDLILRIGENRGTRSGMQVYDLCQAVFMARSDFLRENRWAPELKLGEHWEFFYRIFQKRAGSVTVTEDVAIEHHSVRPAEYERYRRRSKYYLSLAAKMHGFRDASSPQPGARKGWRRLWKTLRGK